MEPLLLGCQVSKPKLRYFQVPVNALPGKQYSQSPEAKLTLVSILISCYFFLYLFFSSLFPIFFGGGHWTCDIWRFPG